MPQTSLPTDPTQADPQIVALMHGLKQNEAPSGNYNQIGDKGTAAGIGQWSNEVNGIPQKLQQGQVPINFQNDAKQYGLDPTDFSPANQNKVMYAVLEADKKAGLTPEQALSKWNSGRANAYLTAPVEGSSVSPTGTQDVAAYVKRGMAAAQAYARQQKQASGIDSLTPKAEAQTTGTTQGQPSSLMGTITNALETIFPGTKQAGEGIGTALFNIGQLVQGKNPFANPSMSAGGVPISGVNPASQVNVPATAGGLLSSGAQATMAGVGGAGSTAVGRIGQMAGLSGLIGAGSAVAGGDTNVGDIATKGALGAVGGGLAGGAGELLSKALNYLPYSVVRKFIPGTNPETAQYAVDKGLGSLTGMYNKSTTNLSKVGGAIESVLTDPAIAGEKIMASDIYPHIQAGISQRVPGANLTEDDITNYLKSKAPLLKNTIDKLVSQGLTPLELNQLKSAIGSDTFKMRFDDPAVKAGKDVGAVAYGAINDFLKSLTVSRSGVKDIEPLFDEYSKELKLNGALSGALRRGEKKGFIGLRELVSMMGGLSLGGPIGAGGALAAEKLIGSPTANMYAGKLAGALGGQSAGLLGRLGTGGAIGNLSGTNTQ